jgi:DNA-binding winged helix-turn-helix (wHTH) protein/TolB-like protein
MSPSNPDLHQPPPVDADPFQLGSWLVSPGRNEIASGQTVVRVEPKAMDVLVYLAQHQDEVVSREELERHVWRGALVGYDAVTNTVIKLRKALGDDPREPTYIATVPKRGYRLVAPIDTAGEAKANILAAPRQASPRPRTHYRVFVTALLTVVALIAIGLLLYGTEAPHQSAPSAVADLPAAIGPAGGTRPTVTVLPFEVLGADPEHLYLARGLTSDIIADLSRLSGLSVVGAAPQQQASGGDSTEAVPARYEVWGGVQRVGQRIKAEVRLIETDTRRQVSVQRYDQPFSDLLDIQDAIGTRLAEALSVKVTEAEQRRRARRYTRSVDAYDLFLRGQAQLLVRGQAENDHARDLYLRAITLDPTFARAYGGLALTYAADYRNQWVRDGDTALARALDLARTALQIDPTHPEIYWTLAYVETQQRQHREALTHLEQALALAPFFADALALKGGIKTYIGEPSATIPLVRSAMRQNPEAGYLYFMVIGRAYFFLDDQVQALINLREAASRNPGSLEVHVYLAAALERSEDRSAAEWEADEIRAISLDFSIRGWIETYPMTDPEQRKRLIATLERLGF